jgi:hypothetical protein
MDNAFRDKQEVERNREAERVAMTKRGPPEIPDSVQHRVLDSILTKGFIRCAPATELYDITCDGTIAAEELPRLQRMTELFKELWNLFLLVSTLLISITIGLLFSPLEVSDSWDEGDKDLLEAFHYWYLAMVAVSASASGMVCLVIINYFYYSLCLLETSDLVLLYGGAVNNQLLYIGMLISFYSLLLAAPPGMMITFGLGKGLMGSGIVASALIFTVWTIALAIKAVNSTGNKTQERVDAARKTAREIKAGKMQLKHNYDQAQPASSIAD